MQVVQARVRDAEDRLNGGEREEAHDIVTSSDGGKFATRRRRGGEPLGVRTHTSWH